jgi:hypothetical protein
MRVTANYFASSNNEEPVQIPARNGAWAAQIDVELKLSYQVMFAAGSKGTSTKYMGTETKKGT